VAHEGLHLAEQSSYVELVDPVTGSLVPDGEPGVVVLTHLDRAASPLVRWWTGDIAVRDSAPCPCGRNQARLVGGVRGRADDMLVIRGVNLFPSAVEQIVRETPGASGEYVIVLDESVRDPGTGYPTAIKIRFEAEVTAPAGIADTISAAVHTRLGVRAVVERVAFGSLRRSEHKTKRVVVE
jgi:phenylacetate-CoA ligase